MFNKIIKAVCFFLILNLNTGSVRAYTISSHVVRFLGLTYLAVQTFNYANPCQPFWTFYNAGISIQTTLQFPIFLLADAAFNPSATSIDLLTGSSTTGTLTGTITAPYGYHLLPEIPLQRLTFEILSSIYYTASGVMPGAGLPAIPE